MGTFFVGLPCRPTPAPRPHSKGLRKVRKGKGMPGMGGAPPRPPRDGKDLVNLSPKVVSMVDAKVFTLEPTWSDTNPRGIRQFQCGMNVGLHGNYDRPSIACRGLCTTSGGEVSWVGADSVASNPNCTVCGYVWDRAVLAMISGLPHWRLRP